MYDGNPIISDANSLCGVMNHMGYFCVKNKVGSSNELRDEKERLEKSLLERGYFGSPIYTWNGYIVDGHNRYEICKKYNIKFQTEELFSKDSFTKTDIMEWMINTQLARRNLIPAQRLVVLNKFKEKCAEEAKENQGKRNDLTYGSLEPNVKQNIITSKRVAEKAQVSPATAKRYDRVMREGDESLKEKMISGEIPITKAYDILQIILSLY